MVEFDIPADSGFVGYGLTQSADAGWNEGHALQYHTYVILQWTDLNDTVAYAYGALLDPDSKLYGRDNGETSGEKSDKPK